MHVIDSRIDQTAEHDFASPRRLTPELCIELVPPKFEGRRECRVMASPKSFEKLARLRKKMQAAGTTGAAGSTRHSLRDGLNAYIALSSVSGL
ncbi:hypothetical protein [Bradyrhizobium sp. USDA 4353]